ncbi:MAG TPA: glycosyltransferase family 4 protein [Pyrinomonadaceae bacterium]|jgi:glycosyltransferase involved in cell wall biosynthesis
MPNNLRKIAWLSPLPPQRSGIANYSQWLIRALKSHFAIDLYCDKPAPTPDIRKEFDVYPLSTFPERYKNYHDVIYHVGNNSLFHKRIYELAWNYPGTIVLHDYNLSSFMHEAFYHQPDGKLYEEALVEGYGEAGRKEFETLRRGGFPDIARFPLSHAIVRRSRKAVVHHRWARNQFGNSTRIEVIPHFAELNHRPTPAQIENFKNKFAIRGSHFVLTCVGFINGNKLPLLQIEVVKRLIDEGYPVQMVFAGEPAPEVKALESETRAGKYGQQIIFTGYQDEVDYFSAIFASDIVINLRNPSMGEASGTLMHALAAAKPTIISDVNQYREFPDRVCWKLTHDENQAEVLYAYLATLLSNRDVRAAMSHNSREYVKSVLDPERIVAQWKQVIQA